MARWDKKKQNRQELQLRRKKREFVFNNGGGTKPYKIKCEGCDRSFPGEESRVELAPCPVCGGETALYDPQLR